MENTSGLPPTSLNNQINSQYTSRLSPSGSINGRYAVIDSDELNIIKFRAIVSSIIPVLIIPAAFTAAYYFPQKQYKILPEVAIYSFTTGVLAGILTGSLYYFLKTRTLNYQSSSI